MSTEAGITIRAVEAADLPATRRWRNDARVNGPALGRRFPINETGERSWFEQLGHGAFPSQVVWAVANQRNEAVGLVQLSEIHWIHRTSMFGIWIGPEFWGQGFATAATRLACEHAVVALGLRQVRLEVAASNEQAHAVYLRCGFVDEARLQRAVLLDGTLQDLLVMRYDADQPEGLR